MTNINISGWLLIISLPAFIISHVKTGRFSVHACVLSKLKNGTFDNLLKRIRLNFPIIKNIAKVPISKKIFTVSCILSETEEILKLSRLSL